MYIAETFSGWDQKPKPKSQAPYRLLNAIVYAM